MDDDEVQNRRGWFAGTCLRLVPAMHQPKSNKKVTRSLISSGCLLTTLNVALFVAAAYLYYLSRHHETETYVHETKASLLSKDPAKDTVVAPLLSGQVFERPDPVSSVETKTEEPLPACEDPLWCNIPMPTTSYFRFDSPTDARKWRIAQLQAARGEQVLLKRVVAQFPGHNDFLDGDITFRKLHSIFDFFVDESRDLSPLVPSKATRGKRDIQEDQESRRLAEQPAITAPKMVNGKLKYPWELEGRRVVPEPYDFRGANRSAVVSIGYTAYTRDQQTYFSGNRVGGAFIDRNKFFQYWRDVKDRIDLPFISICTLNENWGMLSTMFPNRTAGWGRCCDQPKDKIVHDFLNHPKTLMLVTNQHVNLSHPKLLIMPRGIPLTWGFTRMMIWDAQRNVLKHQRKQKLLFAAASNWGPRPQILRCISDKVPAEMFDGHVRTPKTNRLSREQYYQKLGTTMFGVGLPGLGYDTFRAWELMTMGSIVVLERGVGFDRTMYRLPALFVEDFYEITPELLRVAYVEALYRADDFEFERLKQSYWFGFVSNVSATMSVQTILDKFPMSAEAPNFARPREPYPCGKTDTCGAGTKRTPKISC